MNSKTLELLEKYVQGDYEDDVEEAENEEINKEEEKTNETEITKAENETNNQIEDNGKNGEEKTETNLQNNIENNNILENDTKNSELQKSQNSKIGRNLIDLLKDIILNKTKKTFELYLSIWYSKISTPLNNQEHEQEQEQEINDNEINNNNDSSSKKMLLNEIEEELNHSSNEIILEHQNRLLQSTNENDHILNPLAPINDINLDNIYIYNRVSSNNSNNPKNKQILCFSLNIILKNKISLYFFKLLSNLYHKSKITDYQDKLYQLDKLNKKYETILDEKSSIIINKTDEIEEYKEKIEKLSKNLKELQKKQKNLNVIQESLCAKCGCSLEESFTSDAINENQTVIKEQNEVIEKLKKEMSELKKEYNYSLLKIKDFDSLKKEFDNLTTSLLKQKIDNEAQTDESLLTNIKNNNINIQINNNTNKNKNAKKNIPRKKSNNNLSNNSFTSNNYLSTSVGHNNNTNKVNNNNEVNNEVITSLRFDNSVLSNELIKLNKDFNKLRSDFKIINDKNSKLEKDKKEIVEKLKTKTDLSEKLKKENEEIKALINNSKFKTIANAETENKKFRLAIEQNESEIKKLKNTNEKNNQKINEQSIQIEKMKKLIENFNSFKEQKENLILENSKYETELQKAHNELTEEKTLNEKYSVLLNSKDKEIEKLKNEVSYYSFHIKKCKSDAERAISDAIGYQKIVKILEIKLTQYKDALDKIKQNNDNQVNENYDN